MWMDVRASEQAKRIYESGHDALKYNGYGMVSAECLPAKALWLKENEPETYNKATRFYECTDWLMYKLTGEYTASINCHPFAGIITMKKVNSKLISITRSDWMIWLKSFRRGCCR